MITDQKLYQTIENLYGYMRAEEYRGYDPYDTLLSPWLKLPLLRSRIVRFGAQQVCKRIPISLRGPLLIKKGLNPVTIGLSIQAYAYMQASDPGKSSFYTSEISKLQDMLVSVASKGYSGICWGYDFDWEARYTRIDAYVPTSVATGIITNALFEHYLITGDKRSLDLCIDAIPFIRNDLNKQESNGTFCYSYSPVDTQYVLNASTKAARLLAQVYSINGDENLKREAKMSIQFVVDQQKEDGSWPYAVNDARSWSDNYHTGYVLDCLDSYMIHTGDESFRDVFDRGLRFYIDHFFEEDGAPRFYHNKTHPIDSTAAAQSLLTLSRFDHIDLARKVAEWYSNNMISKKGACYFRKHKRYMDRNIFMRWSNAWMLAGFCYLYYRIKEVAHES